MMPKYALDTKTGEIISADGVPLRPGMRVWPADDLQVEGDEGAVVVVAYGVYDTAFGTTHWHGDEADLTSLYVTKPPVRKDGT